MFQNYIKIAIRNLLKHKLYSFIDVIGLAIGITAFLLIIQYVRFEWSFDRFNENSPNIYRVESQFFNGEELVNDMATSSYGYATAMKETFPEIIDYARVRLWDNERVINYNGQKFREKTIPIADASFLTMFSFPMVKGDPQSALAEPNTIVLSESAAAKIFGDEEPIGKILNINTQNEFYVCEVTGILQDIPENSHFSFNYLISWGTISSRFKTIDQFWYQHSAYTYLLLKSGSDIKAIEKSFFSLSEKYKTRDALKNLRWGIELVPLEKIHLNPQKANEREAKGSETGIWILFITAIIILLIAWINFINMSIARSIARAKEIGIRKVVGANKKQLILQFLFESAIINLIAIILSLFFIEIFISLLKDPVGYPHSIVLISDRIFWLQLIIIFLAGISLSGLYPAFMLSSIKPAIVIAGKYKYSPKGIFIRKALVVWQFIATVVLIIGTLMVKQQLDFMNNKSLGVNINQTIVLNAQVGSDHNLEKISVFKEELLKHKEIIGVTASSSIPGREVRMSLSNKRAGSSDYENRLYEMLMTDYDFISLYELNFLAGRNFSKEISTDTDAIILNEESLKLLEFENAESAIDQEVLLEGSSRKFKVIGVVKNYHHQSLHNNIRPIIFFISPSYYWINKYYYSVKISTQNIKKTISNIQSAWDISFEQSSFDYFFLDDFFEAQYKSDKQFENVFSLFTMLAIFISCLGLLGLVAFNTKQKTKEIGIRKVVGASIGEIFSWLLKDYIKWIIIANIIAWPIAYYFIQTWLDNYAFKTEINYWIFILAGISALMIAILTVSLQAFRAARANPIESLKYE